MCKAKKPKPPKFSDPRQNDTKYQQVGREIGIQTISNADQVYQIEKTLSQRQQDEANARLVQMERQAAEQRAAEVSRSEAQFAQVQAQQQRQYEESMAAQQASLQAQLRPQEEMQSRAEEASLRSQVPQMTEGRSEALRIRSRTSSRQQSRRAAIGTSQLRVPLSIGGSMGGMSAGGSPVKLNIGS
jgi:hypothetical protein